MKGLSRSQDSGAWRFLWLCGAAALLIAVFLVILGSSLPLSQRKLISDVGLLAGGLVAASSCAFRSRHSTGRRRRAWVLFAGAMAAAALGNVFAFVQDLTRNSAIFSWLTNASFLAGVLCGLAGLSAFPSVPRRRTDFFRMLSDGVIIGGSIISIASVSIFQNRLRPGSDALTGQSSAVVSALLDVAILTLIVLLMLRTGRTDRPALALLSGGLALYAASDLTRSAQGRGFHYGGRVDVGWIAGYLLVALAARYRTARAAAHGSEDREASPAAGSILIFGLVLVAAVVSMANGTPGAFNVAAGGLWLVLVLAVATRQILLIVDNEVLRHNLERLVDERTNELRRATHHSELLLTSVGEGIYGVDRLGAVTFINPAGARALGYRPSQLIGREAHTTFHHPQDDGTPYPADQCYVTEAIRDGSVTSAETDLYVGSNGRTFAVEVTATPMASDDFAGGAVVVFRDITQRQEVDRLKSEFVSMVSHELRTPLTSIRGSLGLLAGGAMGPLPTPALRMIDLALDSSARLTRLINDILDIERIETGNVRMEIADHRAQTLIEVATTQLQVLASAVDVQLQVSATPGVVRTDADRVVQTLINLLDNAIKFSPPHTTVEVSSRVLPTQIEFQITDQGRGIPEDKIERIFSRFEQVDSSDAREKGGSGLGLAISRSVVDRLGGRIWAESAAGAGATFRFTLPRADLRSGSPQSDLPAAGDAAREQPTERRLEERTTVEHAIAGQVRS